MIVSSINPPHYSVYISFIARFHPPTNRFYKDSSYKRFLFVFPKSGNFPNTIFTSVAAWSKNNDVTEKGKQQKEILKQNGLTK
ncbi:phage holin [Bacillus sp. CLL-3-40]|nr:phage holin [Bacillus changyiensis]